MADLDGKCEEALGQLGQIPKWMCGCVDVRMCGCVDVWMCGCVDALCSCFAPAGQNTGKTLAKHGQNTGKTRAKHGRNAGNASQIVSDVNLVTMEGCQQARKSVGKSWTRNEEKCREMKRNEEK